MVDPGRDSELKSPHGEDPGKTEISQEHEIRTKNEVEDLIKQEQMHEGTQYTHDIPRFRALVRR